MSMGFHEHLSAANKLGPLRQITQPISCFQTENSVEQQTLNRLVSSGLSLSLGLRTEIGEGHVTLLEPWTHRI